MKAAKLGTDGNLSMVDHPMPEPGSGEALIEIIQAGICNTDIEITSNGWMSDHCPPLQRCAPLARPCQSRSVFSPVLPVCGGRCLRDAIRIALMTLLMVGSQVQGVFGRDWA